jgi:hypothetical protein
MITSKLSQEIVSVFLTESNEHVEKYYFAKTYFVILTASEV